MRCGVAALVRILDSPRGEKADKTCSSSDVPFDLWGFGDAYTDVSPIVLLAGLAAETAGLSIKNTFCRLFFLGLLVAAQRKGHADSRRAQKHSRCPPCRP
jgi:hypothetical protein